MDKKISAIFGLVSIIFLITLYSTVAMASQSFQDNGDGTVTDNLTGLMWEQGSALTNME